MIQSVAVAGTDYAGIALIITAVGAVVSPIVMYLLQRNTSKKMDENTKSLTAGQSATHALVDGVKTRLEESNTALKAEVARKDEPGAAPTTQQIAGTGEPGSVGINKGVVTVEDAARDRREGDV